MVVIFRTKTRRRREATHDRQQATITSHFSDAALRRAGARRYKMRRLAGTIHSKY